MDQQQLGNVDDEEEHIPIDDQPEWLGRREVVENDAADAGWNRDAAQPYDVPYEVRNGEQDVGRMTEQLNPHRNDTEQTEYLAQLDSNS